MVAESGPQGRFFDGQSARPHTVDVAVAADGVHIRALDSDLKRLWRFADVRILDAPEEGRPAMITHEIEHEARLSFHDPVLYRAIVSYAPLSAPGRSTLSIAWQALIGWGIAAVSVVALVALGYPRLAVPAAQIAPDSWRESLGEQVFDMMSDGRDVCDAPDGQAALETLIARLLIAAPAQERVRVRVLYGQPVNAFAAPGGEIVLFEALIRQADDPDEVAGVLAHELGHVVHRHPTVGVIRGVGLSVIVQFMFGGLGADNISAAAAQIYSLGYNRDAESEADATAVTMLKGAGLSPRGLATFFERIQSDDDEEDGRGMGKYFSSHPALGDRIERLSIGEDGLVQPARPAMSDTEWQALRSICDEPPDGIIESL